MRFCKIQTSQCQQEGEGWAEVTWGGRVSTSSLAGMKGEESAAELCSPLQTPSLQSWIAPCITFILFLYWAQGYSALPARWKWEFICKFSYLSSGNHSKTCHSTTVWGRDNKMPWDLCKMAERGAAVLTLWLMLDILNYPEIFYSVQRMISFVRFYFSLYFFRHQLMSWYKSSFNTRRRQPFSDKTMK